MSKTLETANLAVFCDFENVALGVRDARYAQFDINMVIERLLLKGNIVGKKAYCDWERYKEFKAAMHEAAFELIEIPREAPVEDAVEETVPEPEPTPTEPEPEPEIMGEVDSRMAELGLVRDPGAPPSPPQRVLADEREPESVEVKRRLDDLLAADQARRNVRLGNVSPVLYDIQRDAEKALAPVQPGRHRRHQGIGNQRRAGGQTGENVLSQRALVHDLLADEPDKKRKTGHG